jgi:hypothetical protein
MGFGPDALRIYLWVIFSVSAFRLFVYIIDLKRVTEVKIHEKVWSSNEAVRLVAYTWTKTVRHLMGFKALISGWGIMFLNPKQDRIECVMFLAILLLSDLHIFRYVFESVHDYEMEKRGKSKGVLSHRNPYFLLTLQSLITLPGCIIFAAELYSLIVHYFMRF